MKKNWAIVLVLTLFSNALYGQQIFIRERNSSRFIEVSFSEQEENKHYLFRLCEDTEESLCIARRSNIEDLNHIIKSALQEYDAYDQSIKTIGTPLAMALFLLTTFPNFKTVRQLIKTRYILSSQIMGLSGNFAYWIFLMSTLEQKQRILSILKQTITYVHNNHSEFLISVDDIDEVWDVITDIF